MQATLDGICALDEELHILEGNDALGALVGATREALIGRDARKLMTTTWGKSRSDLVQIQVSDQGSGVPTEDRASLFTPFFTSKPTALGLGLSISASIVRAQGGRLWFTAPLEGGSRFHFTLPAPASNIEP